MEHDKLSSTTKKTNRFINWTLLWWCIDNSVLNKQVAQYETLKFYQSAKGISVICLLISIAATSLVIILKLADISALADILIFSLLAIFIYFGYKWAMVGAMIFWTFEKSFHIFDMIQQHHFNLIIPIIWWSIYMHAFYLAFKVEKLRAKNKEEIINVDNV